MNCKRILAGALAAATLAGLLVLPAGAAHGSAFHDISDADTAEAAEILRLLGVVDGTGGGSFRPSATLTRAEFCKMAVDVMGKGDLEPAQRNRTIFLDVGPQHWARGYVNLASSLTTSGELADTSNNSSDKGESTPAADRLILGVGNGTFEPNRAITYGEAVAILTRVLGYTTSDIATGSTWYDGYLSVAGENGLTQGLSLKGSSTLTRGEAAELGGVLPGSKAGRHPHRGHGPPLAGQKSEQRLHHRHSGQRLGYPLPQDSAHRSLFFSAGRAGRDGPGQERQLPHPASQ